MQETMIHTNWSLNADTFEKYYLRPANRRQQGQMMGKSILGDTEKKITSEVRVSQLGHCNN